MKGLPGPTAIVGDVHGDIVMLRSLLHLVSGRRLVFLGDLVNRGPESRAVVQLVADLVDEGRAVLVRGNHEAALLSYWRGQLGFVDYALMGGLATLKSYVSDVRGDVLAAFRGTFPERHRRLLEESTEEQWVGNALAKHWDDDAERAQQDNVGRASRGMPLVVGHTIVDRAKRVGDVVFLDSGCGTGGPLSAFLLPEETLVSTRLEH